MDFESGEGARLRSSRHAVTAVAGKALTASFYGRASEHAYFNGCSNGGRQAMMEVQRYPTDFDGIIAGDPATGTPMQAGRALVFQKLLASSDSYLPIAKVEMLSKATVAACDEADGLKDGLVSRPQRCNFKPETLKCAGADAPDCLTAKQLDVVKQIYGGAKLANGETYAYGFPVGHEGGATGWQTWIIGAVPPTAAADGTLNFTAARAQRLPALQRKLQACSLQSDPSFNWRTFKLDRDLPRMRALSEMLSPARRRPVSVQESRRQAADLPRPGRPGDQPVRHRSITTADGQGGRRPEGSGVVREALSRAGDAPLPRRRRTERVRHADRARELGGTQDRANRSARQPQDRRQSRSHAPPLPVPAGSRLRRIRKHRRGEELQVPGEVKDGKLRN